MKFNDPSTLRRFALWNIIFWLGNQLFVTAWYLLDKQSFSTLGVFYLAQISVAALWLSSLSWWQSTRVEEKQDEAT